MTLFNFRAFSAHACFLSVPLLRYLFPIRLFRVRPFYSCVL